MQTLKDLRGRAGQGCVRGNLLQVGAGTLDRLLMGEDDLPTRDAYVTGLVQGLRLSAQ